MAETVPFTGAECLGVIGSGRFGTVYLVQNSSREKFAVKRMLVSDDQGDSTQKQMGFNEVRVLKQLSHEHVLIYVDSLTSGGDLYIITEFCAGGDLNGFLNQLSRPVPEDLLFVWLWQMACGLEYMHTFDPTPIIHRDLKPSNVYLTEKGTIRLGDMGIARILEAPNAMVETFCGTPKYMSPEALYEKPYNEKTDIWSLGCCLAEMVTLERAFKGSTLHVLRRAVISEPPSVPANYSRKVHELMAGMLNLKFELRPTASNILDDDLLKDCEFSQPLDLLRRHKLLDKLANHRGPPIQRPLLPASTPTTSSMLSSDTRINLEEGKLLSDYHEKDRKRMRGRRGQDGTQTRSQGDVDGCVLHTYVRKGSKTKKKTLVTDKKRGQPPPSSVASGEEARSPAAAAESVPPTPAREPSMSQILLNMITSSVSSLQSASKIVDAGMQRSLQKVSSGEASLDEQMEMLKSVVTAILGEETWRKAYVLVMSARSTSDLMAGLRPLLGDLMDQLSNIVIYCFLKESVRQPRGVASSIN
ncbi:serine/threonine-protein kinase Nek2-like [Babylonia areolata]|uniref:serine/threonine-protein kinase Nek2-like n=1 Tax=Babylonia areolata TaxID=304850 RepID=UPI003FCF8ABE